MGVDDIITLEDGKEFLLLLDTVNDGVKYYLAVECINNEPSDHFEVFKEVTENGETSVEEIEDGALLEKLLDDFEEKFDDSETEGE